MRCRIEWQFRRKSCCSAGAAVLPSIWQAVGRLEHGPGWRYRNPGRVGLPTTCVLMGVRRRNVPARRTPPTPAPLKNAPGILPSVPGRRFPGILCEIADVRVQRASSIACMMPAAGLVVSVEHVWRELRSADEHLHDDPQHGGEYDLGSDWGTFFHASFTLLDTWCELVSKAR